MYVLGQGVAQDEAQAVQWYRLAAVQGHAEAQWRLGYMYAWGRGVTQDEAEAVRWLRQAAEQGEAEAQYQLGYLYANGRGVPLDIIQAYVCYRLAAAGLPAGSNRDTAGKLCANTAACLTPAQLASAQVQVRNWQPKPQGR